MSGLILKPPAPPALGAIAGAYYGPPNRSIQSATPTLTANFLFAVPIPVFKTHTFLALCFYNSSAAQSGNKCRTGLYADGPNGPAGLLVDAGEVVLDASAAQRDTVISLTLGPGMYWGVFTCDTSTQLAGVGTDTSGVMHSDWPMFGFPLSAGAGTLAGGSISPVACALKATRNYAALPATFPTVDQALSGTIPSIALKG